MIERLVEQTGMRRADVEAVLRALTAAGADLARPEPRLSGAAVDAAELTARPSGGGERAPGAYEPADHEVSALIAAASGHPLGREFLLRGHLGTVAIMFGVHAFTVDAARRRLTGN